MNEYLRPNRLPAATQAAEGLPRRRWTVAEIEAMVAQGIYDLQTKASAYARLGLPEYWVIDAITLVTSIHCMPGPGGYSPPRQARPDELLEPLLAPQLALRLTDLGLDPAA